MIRPRHTWLISGACLAVLLAAMGWTSLTVLRLEQKAALEEKVRLSLWRMDSALTPLIALESARPYFVYNAFHSTDRAYTRMFEEIDRGEVLVPSRLLTRLPRHVLLHFQFGPGGELTSPQAPTGNMRDLAETRYTTHEKIIAATERLTELKSLLRPEALAGSLPEHEPQAVEIARLQESTLTELNNLAVMDAQKRRSDIERARRGISTLQAQGQIPPADPQRSSEVREGAVKPVWVNGTLVLARRVSVNARQYIQGCWLDWPGIRRWLLGDVKDLLPESDLVPATANGNESRRLAALPLELAPGSVPAGPASLMSPIQVSLLVAWGCVLLAAAAVVVLLRGSVSLSERRGAFVSAVTHEMRTPLTTFRMYSEMLAEGMVPDETRRRRYLDTLRAEADRLGHLVENVLAYARLERANTRRRAETLTVGQLLDRVTERLAERARRDGLELVVEADEEILPAETRVEMSPVEQVLLNLLDNACKYAASAADRRVHLEADRDGRFVLLRVRDHGPGIARAERGQLFRPFRKSAGDAAGSAPGVGLGLALSRRLARSMGGDLRFDSSVEDGACFELALPAP